MSETSFILPYGASTHYEALIKKLEEAKGHAEEEGRVLSEKEWKKHWRLMENEWEQMSGLKKSRRHPSLEALKNSRKPGNTPVPNQDHASIWNRGRTPMVLLSMPYTNLPPRNSEDQVKEFEKLHNVKRFQMPFPGWYNPPSTALDVWMLL